MIILRFMVMATIGLTVVYVCAFLWMRAGLVDRLKAEWADRRPPLPEQTFVDTELAHRLPPIRRKLIIGIYAIPLTLLTLFLFFLDMT